MSRKMAFRVSTSGGAGVRQKVSKCAIPIRRSGQIKCRLVAAVTEVRVLRGVSACAVVPFTLVDGSAGLSLIRCPRLARGADPVLLRGAVAALPAITRFRRHGGGCSNGDGDWRSCQRKDHPRVEQAAINHSAR